MGKFTNLFAQMRERKPILLLGAGFSYGAQNKNGESVPMGTDLSIALFDQFYASTVIGQSNIPEDIRRDIEEKKKDLRTICSALRAQDLLEARNEFLTKVFSGCHVDENAPQNNIINYPWTYIFTLNIDDLVENIYKTAGLPLSVWDYSNSYTNNDPSVPTLVKLHGSVNDAKAGFVFDDDEYRDFTISSTNLLKEFGHQVVQNDLIMIGTEFQESDLLSIISLYEKSGYEKSKYRRYYICPKISNITLRLKFEKSNTEEWVCATTSDFMGALNSHIAIPSGKKQLLRENGVFFLEDVNRQAPSSLGIYKGEDSTYADFFHKADIIHQEHAVWKQAIQASDGRCIFSFWGEDYIGKTCCAKRLLVDLFDEGYDAFQINYLSDRVVKILIDYWKSLDSGSKQAIFIEGAAYSYYDIARLYDRCPSNIVKLIIITEDSKENHKTKRYQLMDEEGFCEIEIEPRMDKAVANLVYEKLSSKRRLGHYLDKIPPKTNPFSAINKRTIISYIIKEQDIIDALYYASEGRNFKEHYVAWMKKKALKSERILLQQMCVLCQLGIRRIPIYLFHQMGRSLDRIFTIGNFVKKYGEVMLINRGYVYLRRNRILYEILKPIEPTVVNSALYQVASYCVPASEFENSEKHNIFEKAIRVRRIRNNDLLLDKEIISLLSKLEGNCKHISYFWVQYGIAAQLSFRFEEANNHLLYAKNMRPYSYQVKHALAKNSMEWGLWFIKEGDCVSGETKFQDGAAEIRELLYNARYKDSFRYSVHTMVDMWLRYSGLTKCELDISVYREISTLLNDILSGPLDDMLIILIKNFIEYCEYYGQEVYCHDLKKVYKRTPLRKADKETYSID